jgi:hypothetical protein
MNIPALIKEGDFKNEKELWDKLNSNFQVRPPLDENSKAPQEYSWYEGLDQEIAAIRLTINCNVSENTIEAPETFNKNQLDVMTSNVTTMIPSIYFAPLGKTVEFYDKEPAIFMHSNFFGAGHDELLRSQHHLACAFTQPFTTPGFPVQKGFFEKTFRGSKMNNTFLYPWVEDVRKAKHLNNRHVNGEDFSDAPLAHWELARQVFLHMGIMNHPEFKSLCVEKLKMNGIQPKKAPFSAARPYKTRPGWRPPFEHYVVTINIPDEVSNESNASTHKKRHHLGS